MLVDVDDYIVWEGLNELLWGSTKPQRVSQGMYLIQGFNLNHAITPIVKSEYPMSGFMELMDIQDIDERLTKLRESFERRDELKLPDDYGVCDSVEQFKELYLEVLTNDPRQLVVSLTRVGKEEQSDWGGWRWHKWGTYVGTKYPQHEYLYDEDDTIMEVYCFHIYEVSV